MNRYRLTVELSAWFTKTVFAVLTTLVTLRIFFQPEEAVHHYPVAFRPLAENEWIIQTGFGVAVIVLWLCYWKIFRIYRGRRAYGTH